MDPLEEIPLSPEYDVLTRLGGRLVAPALATRKEI
jgi:hypothetical protein